MSRRITSEERVKLAQLLIMMKVPKEESLDIMTAMDTPQRMRLFLDKLSEKNFQMPWQEVYQACLDTMDEMP